MSTDEQTLREPKNDFQRLVRQLSIAAQEALYHDIDESQPEWTNGVAGLEPIFANILRGKVKGTARQRKP